MKLINTSSAACKSRGAIRTPACGLKRLSNATDTSSLVRFLGVAESLAPYQAAVEKTYT